MGLFAFLFRKPTPQLRTYKCDKCDYETNWLSHIGDHRLEHEETDMNFTFKTKDEYLAYKVDWKQRYFGNAQEIRRTKKEFAIAQREYSLESKGMSYWDCTNGVRAVLEKVESARRAVYHACSTATELLAERMASKVEAGRQRELNNQPKVAA
jgi:hypothetical protein